VLTTPQFACNLFAAVVAALFPCSMMQSLLSRTVRSSLSLCGAAAAAAPMRPAAVAAVMPRLPRTMQHGQSAGCMNRSSTSLALAAEQVG